MIKMIMLYNEILHTSKDGLFIEMGSSIFNPLCMNELVL